MIGRPPSDRGPEPGWQGGRGNPCRGGEYKERPVSSPRPAPVELVADGDMRFADEERALLHVRLRAVTFLLSAGLALVLVRDLTFGRGPPWPLQAAAVVAMAFLAMLLSAARTCSARGLRMIEGTAFGLAVGVVAVHLWQAELSATARGDPT